MLAAVAAAQRVVLLSTVQSSDRFTYLGQPTTIQVVIWLWLFLDRVQIGFWLHNLDAIISSRACGTTNFTTYFAFKPGLFRFAEFKCSHIYLFVVSADETHLQIVIYPAGR